MFVVWAAAQRHLMSEGLGELILSFLEEQAPSLTEDPTVSPPQNSEALAWTWENYDPLFSLAATQPSQQWNQCRKDSPIT